MSTAGAPRSKARRDWWRFGRADYAVVRIALVLVVLAAVAYLAPPVIDWVSGQPLQVESVTSQTPPAVPGLATHDGATVSFAHQLLWSLPNASTALWLLNLVPKIITSGVVVAGTTMIWRLVSAVERGEPFGRAALWTVRVLAVLVLMWAAVVPIVQVAATMFTVFEARVDPEVEFMFAPWSLAPFVVGILLLVLAELFRVGAGLQDEVEGLI